MFQPIKALNSNGYVRTSVNHRLYHRLLMMKHLGRELRADELVHHKDGDVLHNSINNLEVITRAAHSRYHRENPSEGYEFFGGARDRKKRYRSWLKMKKATREGVAVECILCGKQRYINKAEIRCKNLNKQTLPQTYKCMSCYNSSRTTEARRLAVIIRDRFDGGEQLQKVAKSLGISTPYASTLKNHY